MSVEPAATTEMGLLKVSAIDALIARLMSSERASRTFAEWQKSSAITRSLDVAEAVWRAANDPLCPIRLPAGADAVEWATSA